MHEKLIPIVQASLQALQDEGVLADLPQAIQVSPTRDPTHGDFACNVAMNLAKTAKTAPRQLAEQIVAHLPDSDLIAKVDIAGPGFINFFLKPVVFQQHVKTILALKGHYGCCDLGKDKRIHLEFVSANPTGPLHVGHGRAAAIGSVVANLLEALSFDVHREYYVNDAGRQMQILAVSIWCRYLQAHGIDIAVPAAGYQGDYVIDIATALKVEHNDLFCFSKDKILSGLPQDGAEDQDKEVKNSYVDALIERAKTLLNHPYYQKIFDAGLNTILTDIREDLSEFGVDYQNWFLESSLVEGRIIERSVEKLRTANALYENDGALWFRATDYGDEKDRVVIRANGNPTYFAADIAYHLHKYEQGFDEIIDILGSDHHGYVPRLRAFLQALGKDPERFKVLLVQFAILYRGKEKVKMTTRGGQFVTLRQLRDEVGVDAARYFYIMRKSDQHLDFDLELAKSESSENPVYYLQYAHARICSVFRQVKAKKLTWDQTQGEQHLSLLTEPHEQTLLRLLPQYSEIIKQAALKYEPHLLCHYLQELANGLHSYYNAQQFLVTDDNLRQARLYLIAAVRQVLANGLTILGLSTPEKM